MNATPRWYVVNVYSGYENKVAEAIREQATKKGVEEKIHDILVPTEDIIEVKKGEKKTTKRQFFPGYMLVKVELTDEIWHLIADIPKVTGFLGSNGKGKPTPVSQREVNKIIEKVKEGAAKPKTSIVFEIGEKVRVCEGPFASFTGLVEEIDEEKSRLKVAVSIFGRATPVDLDYTQVEKA